MKKEKINPDEAEETVILTDDEADSINGGGNPFAENPRVDVSDYDEDIKVKI